MKLLDLFCGGGGCSVGYARAGFTEVVGVDLVRQHDYPFPFVLADALTFPLDGFDAVHASPPCKRFTALRHRDDRLHLFEPNGDQLSPMLERLAALPVPWVVENVPGAPMPAGSVRYCGSSFGLAVRRHRLFASNVTLEAPACRHDLQPRPIGVYGNGGAWKRTAPGGGGTKVAGADAAAALGVDWTDRQPVLAQMIPPAYTEHVGRQLLAALGSS